MLNNLASARFANLQLQQLEAILFAEHQMYQLSQPTCKLLLQLQVLVQKLCVFPQVAQQYRPHPKVHPDGQDTRHPGYCKCTWNLLQQPLDKHQGPTYRITSNNLFWNWDIGGLSSSKAAYTDGNSPVVHNGFWMELWWKRIEGFLPE